MRQFVVFRVIWMGAVAAFAGCASSGGVPGVDARPGAEDVAAINTPSDDGPAGTETAGPDVRPDPGSDDVLDLAGTDPHGTDAEVLEDPGLEPGDPGQDPGADGPPVPLFASCSEAHPCQDPLQNLCLLFPGQGHGVCAQPCSGPQAVGECPPWQECVVFDESQKVYACFAVAEYGEPCAATEGVLCAAENLEYCLNETGETLEGRCTRFCDPANPSCAYWEKCVLLPGAGGVGACFDAPAAPSCEHDPCPPGQTCREGRCMATCTTDQDCRVQDHCLPVGDLKACVPEDAALGGTCVPQVGLLCRPGLECLPGFEGLEGYCTGPCSGRGGLSSQDCPLFMSCVEGRCLRDDRLDPGAVPCSERQPCEDPDRVCAPVQPDMGLCLLPCLPGPMPCAAGMTCVGGGCATVRGLGAVCGPDRGILCDEGLVCRVDESKDHHFGYCTVPCGEGCPEGFSCVGGWCAREAAYGEVCSDVLGIHCTEGSDAACLVLLKTLRLGICTRRCSAIGQPCEAPFPGANAQCVFLGTSGYLCGFLCGDLGGTCPDSLVCNPDGICVF